MVAGNVLMILVGIVNVDEKMKYAAIYLPSSDNDMSKWDFKTKAEAKEYMFSKFCEECKKSYQIISSENFNSAEYNDEDYPICSCSAEWMIVNQDELPDEFSFSDIMKAGGAKKISR